ncbi:helix-turn-helix transcriptional regulator [Actinomadura sp. KC216]|uniref:helix-turn-helix domain-containing protein n=1 Tax=Actinomadura sp. KC216 TaxID=2530370 RepID=UPI00140443E9|nr:helix-turn-helix transcriptional regulator [Actinomadura sp. KC216]
MWDWIAIQLRHEREKQNWSTAQVGRLLNTDRSNITHIEAGRRHLAADQAAKLDTAWDTGGRFAQMVDYAQSTYHPDWNRERRTYEQNATAIKTFHATLIPGLLQSEEYARAVFVAGGRADVDAAVAARLARQEVLKRPGVRLWVLLDEAVLLRPVGGPAVWARQLSHLLNASEQPDTVLRIIPLAYGEYPGMDGPITIFTMDGKDVAWTDARSGGRLVTDPAALDRYRVEFDMIGADALSRTESRRLLTEKLEAL